MDELAKRYFIEAGTRLLCKELKPESFIFIDDDPDADKLVKNIIAVNLKCQEGLVKC